MKKLKQDILFETLKKLNVSIAAYVGLYVLNKGTADKKLLEKIPKEYLTEENKLNDKGLNVLNQIDSLFAPAKKLKDEELLGANYLEYIKKFNNIFPTGLLPSGSRARTPEPMLKKKFIRFFSQYKYSWATVIKATHLYVDEYEEKDYEKMRTSGHFIIKKVGEEEFCDLAEYCERVKEGTTKFEVKKIRTHVFK